MPECLGRTFCLPAVRCIGHSVMLLMCLSFPYPCAMYVTCGAVAGLGEGQEKVAWLHTVRKKYSVHVTALRMHGFAGMQGCGCCLERRDSVPVCLLLLAQTRSFIASRSPGHTFTAVWGQGCWLGQQEVKHSSEISGNSFVLGGFVERQVDAAPTIL